MNGWTSIWEILGIDSSSDINEIKKAYASRAKECHPEERPEEFSRLQKAYKAAMRIAKNKKAYEKAAESASEGEGSKQEEKNPEELIREISIFQTENFIWPNLRQENPESEKSESENLEAEKTDTSTSYDYSEIQDEGYQRREQIKADFQKKLMYIIWNPYARNNVRIWNIFLHMEWMEGLFEDPGFRADFVRLIYQERFAGWHRDQIRFFHEYLAGFQSPVWPSQELTLREWDWLLQNAGTSQELLDSPCITLEEKQNYYGISIQNKTLIYSVIHVVPGNPKEEPYLNWYLNYAAKNEEKMEALYRNWVSLREQRFEHRDPESVEKRYLYMIWNPYVRNNISMWKYFLNMKRTRELFSDPGFRMKFASQICNTRFAGWHRDQITFLWQYLSDIKPDETFLDDFSGKGWIWLLKHTGKRGLSFRFITKWEEAAYNDLYTRDVFEGVESEPGKTLEEQYLDWYWRYAEQNEEQLTSVYNKWVSVRKRLFYCGRFLRMLPAAAAMILVLLWEIAIHRPYDSNLRRYQKMYEDIQSVEESLLQEEIEQIMQEYEGR